MWAHHEADANDPGDGHHVLLAERRRVEVEQERLGLLVRVAVPDTGPRDTAGFMPGRSSWLGGTIGCPDVTPSVRTGGRLTVCHEVEDGP